jgi:hypothetical protein
MGEDIPPDEIGQRAIESSCWEWLDLFIAYRRILIVTVMNDWIRSKPELHTSWKRMILSQPEIIGNALGEQRS